MSRDRSARRARYQERVAPTAGASPAPGTPGNGTGAVQRRPGAPRRAGRRRRPRLGGPFRPSGRQEVWALVSASLEGESVGNGVSPTSGKKSPGQGRSGSSGDLVVMREVRGARGKTRGGVGFGRPRHLRPTAGRSLPGRGRHCSNLGSSHQPASPVVSQKENAEPEGEIGAWSATPSKGRLMGVCGRGGRFLLLCDSGSVKERDSSWRASSCTAGWSAARLASATGSRWGTELQKAREDTAPPGSRQPTA